MSKSIFTKSPGFAVAACCVILFVFSGCVPESIDVKDAEILTPKAIPSGKKAKPVQLKRVITKIKRGTVIGSIQAGMLCLPGGELTWKGGRGFVDINELNEVFREEFESANYTVVGDPDSLFDDSSSWQAEYLIGAIITDIEVGLCYQPGGTKGDVYLEVNWQVYSRLDRKVVYKTTTEGSYEVIEPSSHAVMDLYVYAFGMAAQNLLADQKFYALLTGEMEIAAHSPTSFNTLILAKSTQYNRPIEHTINDVRMGVVTVFAGGGHGSGFFIDSDGHMLTSAHVVGGAKFVKIKLVTGREILGEVLRKDQRMDIALVKTGEKNMVPLPINKQELNIGAPVCAIGSPLSQELSSTVTRGIISAYRSVEGMTFIQSDVNILPGNSGCPLVDQNGNAVGVCVRGVFAGMAGLNFFVPINHALNALNVKMVPPEEVESERLLAAKEAESKPTKPKTATSGQTQSPQVASTFPAPESIPKPDSRIKLAILPYYMKSGMIGDGAIISLTNMKKTSIDSLNKVLRDNREMVPTYSYYELAKELKAKKISDRNLNDKDVNNLWVKKTGYSSSMKPNINLACKIGNKLKVDTLLLYSITHKSGEPNWTMTIYFIDVETKKTFLKTTSIYFRTYRNEIENFTEQSFDVYSTKKSKSQSDSASETQVAAIPEVKVNKKEPWTGVWKVEGSHQETKGLWGLKQRGKSVVSTKDSFYEVNGKVKGDQLEGRFRDTYNLSHRFVIKISSDGQSFEGKIYRHSETIQVKGRRKQ
jgi:S1-C subfamily serine protease